MTLPSYQTRDPKGWMGDPKRGAALGRPNWDQLASARCAFPEIALCMDERCARCGFTGRLTLRYVRLDSGGYDINGTYWGHHKRLYWYASDDNRIDGTLHAEDRAEARSKVLAKYPRAKVRR